jgi:hypothetical protein
MKAADFAASIGARVVLPSKSVLDGHPVNLHDTDVQATWKAWRDAQKPAPQNVCSLKKRAK